MIGIIDYGLGNVTAFLSCYRELNIPAVSINDPSKLKECSHIILPGVGAFDEAINKLKETYFFEEILNCSDRGQPILGICVGMQILAEESEEGSLKGLGLIPGAVKSFKNIVANDSLPMPHMGWNSIDYLNKKDIFYGIDSTNEFYFLHSFFYDCKLKEHEMSYTNYGINFCSSVNNDNVYGVQFHPEKSHHCGKKLLKNFFELNQHA